MLIKYSFEKGRGHNRKGELRESRKLRKMQLHIERDVCIVLRNQKAKNLLWRTIRMHSNQDFRSLRKSFSNGSLCSSRWYSFSKWIRKRRSRRRRRREMTRIGTRNNVHGAINAQVRQQHIPNIIEHTNTPHKTNARRSIKLEVNKIKENSF